MIESRPAFLLADATYGTLPKLPLALDWSSVPELIRAATLDLGGIQPVTKAMAEAAGGTLHDKPSDGEVALFTKRGATFQLISIVLSCVPAGHVDGVLQVRPFAMTLIPASKCGQVTQQTIDFVKELDVGKWLETEPMYAGYNPFTGDWSLDGNLPGYLDGERKGYFDEIGLVIDQFFLATDVPKDDEILTMDLNMPSGQMKVRYERHRRKLFFTPFKKVVARVCGAETPIELFVLQALAKENLLPECQMLIMDDGATFPSLYHLWSGEAMIVGNDRKAVISVNSPSIPARQRFSIGHELGPWHLHRGRMLFCSGESLCVPSRMAFEASCLNTQ